MVPSTGALAAVPSGLPVQAQFRHALKAAHDTTTNH
jgi:hypothetical protein